MYHKKDVDVVRPYFAKAFDSMLHRRLGYTMQCCGAHSKGSNRIRYISCFFWSHNADHTLTPVQQISCGVAAQRIRLVLLLIGSSAPKLPPSACIFYLEARTSSSLNVTRSWPREWQRCLNDMLSISVFYFHYRKLADSMALKVSTSTLDFPIS